MRPAEKQCAERAKVQAHCGKIVRAHWAYRTCERVNSVFSLRYFCWLVNLILNLSLQHG